MLPDRRINIAIWMNSDNEDERDALSDILSQLSRFKAVDYDSREGSDAS